jgi:hypothetical protein
VFSIGESLRLAEDFGGLNASWDNPSKANISVFIMTKDKNDEYMELGVFYSSAANGTGIVRGMDTIPISGIAYAQDRWNNKSEPKSFTLTPIYEAQFNRENFKSVRLTNDPAVVDGYTVETIFDGNKNGDPCYSSEAGSPMPQWLTFDLGVSGKLSRIRIYQRTGENNAYLFGEGNIREFEIWGCLKEPSRSGDWKEWTLLSKCVSEKPSGLPFPEYSNDDLARAENGEDFIIPIDSPQVRYLRIRVNRTWANGSNFQIGEIEVFGDYR